MAENEVTIELSKAQINRVVRGAAEDGGLLGLLGGVEGLNFRVSPAQLDDPRLSHSLLRGLMVLACFPADGSDRSVTEVARRLDMGVSMIHRYVSTLMAVELLERDPVSREYRLAGRE